MGNQSKLYLSLFEAIPYTCYEVGHTWNPSCFASFFEAFKASFISGLKLMIPSYGVRFCSYCVPFFNAVDIA